ncbi:MAG: hypothetical protein ACKV2O_13385 [Acidimicrobiales bacterium]
MAAERTDRRSGDHNGAPSGNGAPVGVTAPSPASTTSTATQAQLEAAAAAVEAARRGGNRSHHADALMRLGRFLAGAGHRVEAAAAFEAAAVLAADEQLPELQARALANAGASLCQADQPREGLLLCHRALQLFAELGDLPAQQRLWANSAVIHQELGQFDQARQAAARAETLQPPGRVDVDLLDMQELQVSLAHQAGDLDAALDHAGNALTSATTLGDQERLGQQLETIASLMLQRHGPTAALPRCFGALTHYRDLGDESGLYRSGLQLALVYQHLGRWHDALAALTDALRRVDHHGAPHDVPLLHASLAATNVALGQMPAAAEQARQAVAGYRAVNDRLGLGRALVTLGQCVAAGGDPVTAAQLWHDAHELLRDHDPDGALVAATLLSTN